MNRRSPPHAALLRSAPPFVALLLAACATLPPASGQATPGMAVPATTLAGSRWRLIRLDGAPVASERAGLAFEADQLQATAGCNRMTGRWREADGTLASGPLAATKMFCAGPVGEQEQALAALLQASPAITRAHGRLDLQGAGHRATFVPAP